MSFDARYADDPVASASVGFDELAKGMFQIWRFLSHARRGLTGDITVAPSCCGVIVTADSWLPMASRQAGQEIGRDTSELPSLMRISYAVFRLKKKNIITQVQATTTQSRIIYNH